MAYQLLTNVANMDTLLGYIRDFIVATGDWTVHQNMITPDEDALSPNQANGSQLVVSNGDCLAGLRSSTSGPGANRLYLFDGIPAWSSSNLDSMPGNSGLRYSLSDIGSSNGANVRGIYPGFPGPFPKAHLFTDDPSTYIHIVIEVSAGVFKHMMFGNLIKFGTWTGGGYYCGDYWATDTNNIDEPSGQHNIPFDNIMNQGDSHAWTVHYVNGSDNWICNKSNDGTLNSVMRRAGRSTMRGGFNKMFSNIPESTFSGLIPLAPIVVAALRISDTPDTTRFIGMAPDVRAVNITNLAPGATITIGSDTWMCFPLKAKNGATDQYNSGVGGFAFKVIS